jgi:hypothetical protein
VRAREKYAPAFQIGAVVAILVLSGIGVYLAVRPGPPPPVVIQGITWHFLQGNDSQGSSWNEGPNYPWFGPGFNDSGPVYQFPLSVGSGGTWNQTLILVDTDLNDQTVYSVTFFPQSRLVGSYPPLPARFEAGEDIDWILTIQVTASPGSVIWLTGTINCLG